MHTARTTLTILAAVLIAVWVGPLMAFHDGGVADCVGCHQMHDAPGDTLLVGLDTSSTCLSCHEDADATGPDGYHVSTSSTVAGEPPLQMTPGGDFGWIKKTYSYQPWGGAPVTFEFGETHGHNIEAVEYGYVAETGTAPGGGFNAANLSCVSCHDMHGKYRWLEDDTVATYGAPIIGSGSYDTSGHPSDVPGTALGVYRLLGGVGHTAGGSFFTANPPVAFAPSTYNRSEDEKMTRVAYGEGMSGWCGQCHPDMHLGAGDPEYHPSDVPMNGVIDTHDIYNNYRGSGTYGDPSNLADDTTSFLSLVPFEEGLGYAASTALQANASPKRLPGGFPPSYGDTVLTGPNDSTSKVMCLSCHRAHASGWEYAMRWNNEVAFLSADGVWAGTDHPDTAGTGIGEDEARGRTVAEATAAYHNIPASGIAGTGAEFATFQRSLCNKCHAND